MDTGADELARAKEFSPKADAAKVRAVIALKLCDRIVRSQGVTYGELQTVIREIERIRAELVAIQAHAIRETSRLIRELESCTGMNSMQVIAATHDGSLGRACEARIAELQGAA